MMLQQNLFVDCDSARNCLDINCPLVEAALKAPVCPALQIYWEDTARPPRLDAGAGWSWHSVVEVALGAGWCFSKTERCAGPA